MKARAVTTVLPAVVIAVNVLASGCTVHAPKLQMTTDVPENDVQRVASAADHAGGTALWGYSGPAGPDRWAELDSRFCTCAEGRNQSPVDLTDCLDTTLQPLVVRYQSGGHEIINNGHTVQVNYQAGNVLVVDGRQFELKQFHFHAPSEHRIKGAEYPLEAHFVHADPQGNLAVVGVMFTEGPANEALAKAWAHLPEKAGEKHRLSPSFSAESLLPTKRDFYRYNGSLTTPPCSEGVLWIVMKEAVTVSKAQVEEFARALHHPNNRPVQPLNARVVLE